MTQTTLRPELVTLSTTRDLEEKLSDIQSVLDYGATVGGTAGANTTAINTAIAAVDSGFLLVPPGVSYTEASLVMSDSVILIIFGSNSTVTFLTKNQGDSVASGGGVIIKSQGDTGILLKATDYGVTAEPVIQLCDATTGDAAAIETKFIEGTEISDPTAPAANKGRLYYKDNGSGATQLAVRFATGDVLPLATSGRKANLTGSTTWDPASIADGDKEAKDVTVTGAAMGDYCIASFSLDVTDLSISATVTAADTVTVVLANNTGGAVDLGSGTVSVLVLRNY